MRARDVEAAPKASRELTPLHKLTGHTATAEDVSFHMHNEHLLASVADDSRLMMCVGRRRRASPVG